VGEASKGVPDWDPWYDAGWAVRNVNGLRGMFAADIRRQHRSGLRSMLEVLFAELEAEVCSRCSNPKERPEHLSFLEGWFFLAAIDEDAGPNEVWQLKPGAEFSASPLPRALADFAFGRA